MNSNVHVLQTAGFTGRSAALVFTTACKLGKEDASSYGLMLRSTVVLLLWMLAALGAARAIATLAAIAAPPTAVTQPDSQPAGARPAQKGKPGSIKANPTRLLLA